MPDNARKVRHEVNGDQQNGWYCYICDFTTRDVGQAAAHDGRTDIELEYEERERHEAAE